MESEFSSESAKLDLDHRDINPSHSGGVVSSDFHRLTGATSKVNSKYTQLNQAPYAFFFHRAPAKPIHPIFQTGFKAFWLHVIFLPPFANG